MKSCLLLAALLMTTLVHAGEVTLKEYFIPGLDGFRTMVNTSFYMDTATGEGHVKVTVTEDRYINTGHYDQWGRWYPHPTPMPQIVLEDTLQIEGLSLVDDKMIYQTPQGDVECGYLGESRVFRRPTLYLNGNCKLSGKVSGNWNESKVIIKLKTAN